MDIDYAFMFHRLVPGAKYANIPFAPAFRWLEESIPCPTIEECEAEWQVFLAEQAKEEANAQAYADYVAAVEAGFNYNGVVYDCDDKFTTDLVKMVMLTQLDPEEPVYLMDKAGNVRTMSCDAFKVFASALGYYAYGLRQQYWSSLQ